MRSFRSVILAVVAVLVMTVAVFSATPEPTARPILVLYSFGEEGRELTSHMTITDSTRILGRMVRIGQLEGKQIVLAASGVGMTNAAMNTQRIIDQYHPKAVLFSGIAGAIDTTVHIGDIVVASEWVQHDYGYVGPNGFEPDTIWTASLTTGKTIPYSRFPVDSTMLAIAGKIEHGGIALDSVGTRRPAFKVGGVGATGNAFIDSKEKREWLTQTFKAQVVDMESAAIAHVCTLNELPFIIFRSASDLAGGSGSATAEGELNQFFKVAAKNSALVMMQFLKVLP